MKALPAALGFDVSRETAQALEHYIALLTKWNRRINLVAPSTMAEVWERHVVDSAQVFAAAPVDARSWTDLGSGGGFPGLVVAMLARQFNPELTVTLVEADARKATFLRTVLRETETSATVVARRIEETEPQEADVVSARALAPLYKLLEYVARHCRDEGVALLLKGQKVQSELSVARDCWQFECEESPSLTDSNAVLLKIRNIRHV